MKLILLFYSQMAMSRQTSQERGPTPSSIPTAQTATTTATTMATTSTSRISENQNKTDGNVHQRRNENNNGNVGTDDNSDSKNADSKNADSKNVDSDVYPRLEGLYSIWQEVSTDFVRSIADVLCSFSLTLLIFFPFFFNSFSSSLQVFTHMLDDSLLQSSVRLLSDKSLVRCYLVARRYNMRKLISSYTDVLISRLSIKNFSLVRKLDSKTTLYVLFIILLFLIITNLNFIFTLFLIRFFSAPWAVENHQVFHFQKLVRKLMTVRTSKKKISPLGILYTYQYVEPACYS